MMVIKKVLKSFFRNLKKRYWYFKPYYHYQDVILDLKKTIKKRKKGTQVFLLFSPKEKKILALAKFVSPLFDKKVFGFDCGRIEYLIFSESLEKNFQEKFVKEILKENKEKQFIDIGIDARDIFLAKILKKIGFQEIKNHRFYYKKLADNFKKNLAKPEILVRSKKKEDLPILKRLAGLSFIYSRFYWDRNFKKRVVKKFYEKWLLNSFKDEKNHRLLVATLNKQIVGFLDCKVLKINKRKIGIIDLIAVDKHYQGKGVGKSLLLTGFNYFQKRKIKEVYAETEEDNLSAQKLYESLGMKVIAFKKSFHFWNAKR